MAESDTPQRSTVQFSLDVGALTARLKESWARHWEIAIYLMLVVMALGLRFWDLGSRAYNHDESLHAQYSWYLYDNPDRYDHDPMMHGPFQFHFNALIFRASEFLGDAPVLNNWVDWGPSDYTGRVLPAIFGTALVFLPFFLRGYIGRLGALLAALFLTFSPVLLFFSRFARNDIYIGFFTLALVILIWRYLSERRPLYLYLSAAVLALSFATKEVTFMTVALLLLYLDLLLAWDILSQLRQRHDTQPSLAAQEDEEQGGKRRRKRKPPPQPQRPPVGVGQWAMTYVALVPFAWLLTIIWPLIGGQRRRWGLDRLPASGELLLILGTLSVPQFAAAIQALPFVGDKGFYREVDENALMKATVLVLIVATTYFGVLWNFRTWLICAGIFYAIYVVLYTSLFTNMGGFWSGIWGSLDYWLMQQHVKRGDQPVYYYLMILPMYEFLPLVFAMAGAVFFALKRHLLTSFLVFWAIGALIAFAMAGEKMPWLAVHIVVPVIMLAAKLLNDLFERFSVSLPLRWRMPETLVLLGALAGALAMIMLWGTDFSVVGAALALVIGAMALLLVVRAWSAHGALPAAQTAAALVGAAFLILTVRTGVRASFDLGDWPREILSYADSSPGMPWIRDQIVKLGKETGLGRDYPVVIDNDLAWPMVWYLRDHKGVQWAYDSLQPPVAGSLVVLKVPNESWMDPYLDQYQEPVRTRHYWWFGDGPQYYDGVTLGSFFRDLFKGSTWDVWRDYFVYRQLPWEPPPDDVFVYFPKSLENVGKAVVEAPPPIPTVAAQPQLTIGEAGSGKGQLNLPTGLDVDVAGNLYVADTNNSRIQKFDPQGKLLTVLGLGGDKSAAFKEPWSLVVDKDGNIYVADTWNHRIQKFDPNLNLITTWGKAFAELGSRQPDPEEFFGPRDIAIDADGNILVTDTGNKRVVKFTPDGQPIGAFGKAGTGPGEFNEPVGIAVGPNGDIYVADTWNRRVQVFDSEFTYLREFKVIGWGSTDVTAKPYLAVLSDGRVVLSNPMNARIEVYDQNGSAVAAWELPTPASGVRARPVGVTLSGQGVLFVADCVGNKVYGLSLASLVGP